MSVTTYDSRTAFKQDQVARLGDRAADRVTMTVQDRQKFEQSPFMVKMKEIDNQCWRKFSDRDKKRAQRDPNFRPRDEDFEAPKAHSYDKNLNYYKVLGVDELATNDEVKKAYRKLSLTYHPDKSSGKTQEEKDEYAAIFMEVKNAYKTLSDEPTRRQYDYDRERDSASHEAHGKKPHEKASFDAIQALLRLAEKKKEAQRLPGEIVRVPIQCRLEKFVYGGNKSVERSRLIKDKEMGGFREDTRLFRVDIPPGAEMPFTSEFRRQGDQHEDREPDTLKFAFTAKSHAAVDRVGEDLRVRQTVEFGERLRQEPFVACQAPSIAGRHVLIWGRNPFFHWEGKAEVGEVQLRLAGEGASSRGALLVQCRLGLRDAPTARPAAVAPAAAAPLARGFVERFGLGPQWGDLGATSRAQPAHGRGLSEAPAMRRRLQSRGQQRPRCELELERAGEPIGLFTKPHSSIAFFASRAPSCPMFALCLSSPPCGKKKAAADWDRLKARLVPLLQISGFWLLPTARAALPRPLAARAGPATVRLPGNAPALPWKRLGDDAFRQGDPWRAMVCYAERLQELGLTGTGEEQRVDPADGVQRTLAEVHAVYEEQYSPEEREEYWGCQCRPVSSTPEEATGLQAPEAARLLCNRAACLAKVGDLGPALEAARRAANLAPKWAKPWSRTGLAAWRLGLGAEAVEACLRAVELEPTRESVGFLHACAAELEGPSVDAAHVEKERGNEAAAAKEFGLAAARYTAGLARLPPAPAQDGEAEAPADQHGLLRAILRGNRCAAFCRLRLWQLAVEDGREAVASSPGIAYARCQLGCALLGCGQHQEAYAEFAKGLQLEQEHKGAQKGRSACLKELVLWKSASASERFKARFWIDLKRPKNTTRIFALSDIHFDHKYNEDWVHAISDQAFQDDVLIVAGNMADTKKAVERGLSTLKAKFRRVFYSVGNHEMYIHHSEYGRYPDSISKLNAIFSTCDQLGVDIFPAPICEGLFVLPLLSWYTAEFDEEDPFPDPNQHPDKACKWPMDADVQVWRYMVKLNEPFLRMPLHGDKITVSHFLPRRELPFEKPSKRAAKTVGCEMIEEQLRAVGSRMHVYGHSRVRHAQTMQGVRYVHQPLGYDSDWPKDHVRRLLLLHDGLSFCAQEWGADGEPPLGFVKRVQVLSFFVAPGLKDVDSRRVHAAVKRLAGIEGVKASFERVGSAKKDRAELVKDVWPDLGTMGLDASHGLLAVADDLDALKRLLHSEPYKDIQQALQPNAQKVVTVLAPLGLDLVHEKKPDPMLMVYALRLEAEVTPDSEKYAAICKAADAINKLPGVEGKIAVGLQATGFGKLTHKEVLEKVDVYEDKSAGATHLLSIWVDSPASFKMLAQSKTFAKWKGAYEPCLGKPRAPGPQQMAFCIPMEIAVTAAAPKKAKKPPVAQPKAGGAAWRR